MLKVDAQLILNVDNFACKLVEAQPPVCSSGYANELSIFMVEAQLAFYSSHTQVPQVNAQVTQVNAQVAQC